MSQGPSEVTPTDEREGRMGADDLKTILTRRYESGEINAKMLFIGYGRAATSRATTQLALTGEMQPDKRERLTS